MKQKWKCECNDNKDCYPDDEGYGICGDMLIECVGNKIKTVCMFAKEVI